MFWKKFWIARWNLSLLANFWKWLENQWNDFPPQHLFQAILEHHSLFSSWPAVGRNFETAVELFSPWSSDECFWMLSCYKNKFPAMSPWWNINFLIERCQRSNLSLFFGWNHSSDTPFIRKLMFHQGDIAGTLFFMATQHVRVLPKILYTHKLVRKG